MYIDREAAIVDLQEHLPIFQNAICNAINKMGLIPLDLSIALKPSVRAAMINNLMFDELKRIYNTGDKIGRTGEFNKKEYLSLHIGRKRYFFYFNKLDGNFSATQNGTIQSLNLFNEQYCFDGLDFDVIKFQCGYSFNRLGDLDVKLILAPGQIDSWSLSITALLEQKPAIAVNDSFKSEEPQDQSPRRTKTRFKPLDHGKKIDDSGTDGL